MKTKIIILSILMISGISYFHNKALLQKKLNYKNLSIEAVITKTVDPGMC